MSFDYDLIVIGSSLEGIYAAKKAVLLQARVGLVTQSKKYLNLDSFIYSNCLQEITNFYRKFENNPWGICSENIEIPTLSLERIETAAKLIKENITAEHSLEELAILGVDVIYGKGEFCRLPKQAFLVNNRVLRSRNFLLAIGTKYTLETDEKTLYDNCFTLDSAWQNLAQLPKKITIIGGCDRSLELAQTLAKLGKIITFVASGKLLPEENIVANRLFQAQFAAENIQVFINASVKNIQALNNKISLQINDIELEAESIIFADNKIPNVENLNLEGVKVKYSKQGIIVNQKLQTTNKSIYACGEVLGKNNLIHIWQYEADIALKNMLSFPWFKTDYSYLPRAVFTQPMLASVGITKIDDLSDKKQKIYLITRYFKSISAAQISANTRGWCQVIVRENGEILGSTIVGDHAIELINIICLMMRHKIKLTRNPIEGLLKQEIPYIVPSFGEILNQITLDFHQKKLQCDRGLKRRLETWFSWRK